jgi:hypothetical protein
MEQIASIFQFIGGFVVFTVTLLFITSVTAVFLILADRIVNKIWRKIK